MIKKTIVFMVVALGQVILATNDKQYVYYGSDNHCCYALIPDQIKDCFEILYTEKKMSPSDTLAGLYVALVSGYCYVPYQVALAACDEAFVQALLYHKHDMQKILIEYKNQLLKQTPVIWHEQHRGSAKNKIVDCLVVKGSARIDTLCVGGTLCGIVAMQAVNPGATGSTGVNGFTGNQPTAQDARGARGATGPEGVAGLTGTEGLPGARGAFGAAGGNGITGAVGATGFTGNDGSVGAPGINGATGATGSTGFAGNNGVRGMQAVTGNTGATLITQAYGYLYKTNSNIVEYGTRVTFSALGPVFNITYTVFTDPVIFDEAGTYQISVVATAISTINTTPNNAALQIGLLLNGVPIDGGQFGAGATNEPPTTERQAHGQIIVTVNAGDQITVINTSSIIGQGFFTFFNRADSQRPNTNLSMTIRRLD